MPFWMKQAGAHGISQMESLMQSIHSEWNNGLGRRAWKGLWHWGQDVYTVHGLSSLVMHDGLVGDTFLIKFGLQIKHNTLVDFAASGRGIIGNEDQDSLFISTLLDKCMSYSGDQEIQANTRCAKRTKQISSRLSQTKAKRMHWTLHRFRQIRTQLVYGAHHLEKVASWRWTLSGYPVE